MADPSIFAQHLWKRFSLQSCDPDTSLFAEFAIPRHTRHQSPQTQIANMGNIKVMRNLGGSQALFSDQVLMSGIYSSNRHSVGEVLPARQHWPQP